MSAPTRYHPTRPNAYSARNTIKPIPFVCLAPDAQHVTIAGDFNDWDGNSHPLTRMVDGAWRTEVLLPHGYHHYRFLVDGEPTLDPRAHGVARNAEGERVSLIAVS